jgi:predicted SprT family Zn-dependent metalloprotease
MLKFLKQFFCKCTYIKPVRDLKQEKIGVKRREYECEKCGKRLIMEWKNVK